MQVTLNGTKSFLQLVLVDPAMPIGLGYSIGCELFVGLGAKADGARPPHTPGGSRVAGAIGTRLSSCAVAA